MNLIPLDKQIKARKKVSFNVAKFAGIATFIVLFILALGAGFLGALIFGLLFGGGLFALIYYLREFTHKGVERRRKKLTLSNPHLDVTLNGEIGILEICDDKFVFHNLTPGASKKPFEVPIDENLFIASGDIKYRKIQGMTHKHVASAYIMIKPMPHGLPRQFVYFNIDGAIDKVLEELNRVNKYQE